MEKCPWCKTDVPDGSSYCPGCGVRLNMGPKVASYTDEKQTNKAKTHSDGNAYSPSNCKTIGILAIVFSLLIWPVGLILSIVGLAKDKARTYTTFYIIGLVLSGLSLISNVITVLTGF